MVANIICNSPTVSWGRKLGSLSSSIAHTNPTVWFKSFRLGNLGSNIWISFSSRTWNNLIIAEPSNRSIPWMLCSWKQYYRLYMAWEDRMNVIWVRPFSETYPLRFWHYRYTGTYPISLWNVYHTFKRQNSILTYATLPITKHLQLHVAYCF